MGSKTVEELRLELQRLDRRNAAQPERVTIVDRVLDSPVTAAERAEYEQYAREGGTQSLGDWVYVLREFRRVFGESWPNLRVQGGS